MGLGPDGVNSYNYAVPRSHWTCLLPAACVTLALAPGAWAQDPPVVAAPTLYTQHCASCHDAPDATRAPSQDALRQRSPETILTALTTGVMKVQGASLADAQKRILAVFLSGRPLGSSTSGSAAMMSNPCGPKPFMPPTQGASWNGWGADPGNARFQPAKAAGLTAAQVPNLKLKWAFGLPNVVSAYSQPTVAGGRVYVGGDGGYIYALDAASGCVHWSYPTKAGVRTAITLGPVKGQGATRWAAYFGDIQANVYAVDAETGRELWTVRVESHPLARITGAPALHEGRLYVPMSSLEEAVAANANYECCTFRGSVTAVDASTGKTIWKTYMIPEPSKAYRKTSVGTQLYGPSGSAIWGSPTVDLKAGRLYVATGDAYSEPTDESSDAIVAMDLKTGRRLWVRQLTPKDVWVVGCPPKGGPDNCPRELGPDFDFGSHPVLRTHRSGRQVLTAGQKSGIAWGLDLRSGEVVWEQRVGKGSAGGGVVWGPAADDQQAYFATNDQQAGQDAGGLSAVDLLTGKLIWSVKPGCVENGRKCEPAQPAAVTVIPGVVFSGSLDGVMRAYSTVDGRVLWQFDSVRAYATVNGVPGKGGGLNGPGVTVVGGTVYMNSGYSAIGGVAGNVLLAFGVD